VLVPSSIIDTSEGLLITRASGLFALFEEAITCAAVLIECCIKDPKIARHVETIKVMHEHIKNATSNYMPFAAASAIPHGNTRRLIYRINKLASLGSKLAELVKNSQTPTARAIKAKSKSLEEIRDVIHASITLLAEKRELYE